MKVLVLSNGNLEEREISNDLGSLQKIVGGYIEIPFLSNIFNENGIDVIINEEGKLIEGMQPEIALADKIGYVLDIIYGNCIFASHDEEGNTIGLNEEQIKIIMEVLKDEVMLYNKNEDKKFFVRVLFV